MLEHLRIAYKAQGGDLSHVLKSSYQPFGPGGYLLGGLPRDRQGDLGGSAS